MGMTTVKIAAIIALARPISAALNIVIFCFSCARRSHSCPAMIC
ncbi:MAG: hypothetical protein SCARUB_01975 [Candidatus Scalindua rubra]|uniref:Uncharacterized protein n=1 Tax=Candidatus Scalindua rubra TaxID=1872076 RepID=A0A1E3XB96_9BACT|nr:MAG: hypothetical protein SCARUB_01975 [Candidatus Scalindua rubra]